MNDMRMFDSMFHDGLNDAFSGKHSGWHTEDLEVQNSIGPENQERWALRSQQRSAAAQAAGRFEGRLPPLKCRAARTASSRRAVRRPRFRCGRHGGGQGIALAHELL